MKKSDFSKVSYIITTVIIMITILSALILKFINFPSKSEEYYAWFEPIFSTGEILFTTMLLVVVAIIYISAILLLILSQTVLLIIGIIKTIKNKDINYGHVVLVNSVCLVLSSIVFIIEFIV